LAEPTDDAFTEVLLPGHLFQEESHTLLELLVRELGRLVIFEVRINAIGLGNQELRSWFHVGTSLIESIWRI
jgi:hypothetical protein